MDDKYLYDIFEIYYKNAMQARDKGNNEIAKANLLKSAETLLKLAKQSEGSLKIARMDRAERLFNMASSINVNQQIIKDYKQSANQNRKSPINNAQSEENDETKFEAVDIPNISFEEVAGLESVKDAVRKRIILPMKRPDLYEVFNKKSGGGILMYGLPGTGKTMIAKAIANEVQAKFYEIKCSSIVSKWFGEAEQNIKNLFIEARRQERALIFFDEFEALAAKRGGNSTVMNRIVPELLAQIQGFSSGKNTLLLIAATNRPWDIDSAMLRPGRFNELIYIPLPDEEARSFLVKKSFNEVPVEENFNFDDVVKFTDGGNCSDVEEFCDRIKNEALERSLNMTEISKVRSSDIEEIKKNFRFSVYNQDIDDLKNFEKENMKI